jgi:hypothetical protein
MDIIEFTQEQEVFRAHGLTRDGGNLADPSADAARHRFQERTDYNRSELARERCEALEFDLLRYVMEGGE